MCCSANRRKGVDGNCACLALSLPAFAMGLSKIASIACRSKYSENSEELLRKSLVAC